MYLLILFLPFLSFLVAALFGRYIGRNGRAIITVPRIVLTAIFPTIAFYEVALASSNCYLELATWIDSAMLHAS